MDEAASPFAVGIKHLLAEKGWSQGMLARRIGRSQSYISHIIRGDREGRRTTLEQIAEAFGSTYEEMLALGRRLLAGEGPAVLIPASDGACICVPIRRAHRPLDTSSPEPWVAEALGQAWAVLESGTKTAEALLLNIQEFYEKVSPPAQGKRRKRLPAGVETEEGARRRVANGG